MRHSDPYTAYLVLCQTERMPLAAIEYCQGTQLRELLTHTLNEVPYYQRLFKKLHLSRLPKLQELPILTRETLREQLHELTPSKLPGDLKWAGSLHTSGSSGKPVKVHHTTVQREWHLANTLRYLSWYGCEPGMKLASIRHQPTETMTQDEAARLLDGIVLPYWEADLFGLVKMGPSCVMDIRQNHRKQYEWLQHMKPDVLVSYPTNLRYLAELAHEQGPVERLLHIITMSETLEDEQGSYIADQFDANVYSVYSCRELGVISSECAECGDQHVFAENVIVEIVDDNGRPCLPGETGRVLVTGLHSFASPLIRYDIGDRATLSTALPGCSLGLGLPTLRFIQGRELPAFLMPDGTRRDSMDVAVRVRRAGDEDLCQFVLTQTARYEVSIVTVLSARADPEAFRASVTKELHEYFGSTAVKIEVTFVKEIPLTAAGKAPPCLVANV